MNILPEAIEFAKQKLNQFDGGHDWLHTERVLKTARIIQQEEGAGDLEIIELAVVFHDIADTKFHEGSESDGGDMAFNFLIKEGLSSEKSEHIRMIINNISFRNRHEKKEISSIEFQIVQDADRLDAMGAIGIARAFNYGGFKNRPLYDHKIPPAIHQTSEGYKASTSPTINHFHEKLFLLKELMNTETGRKMAQDRHTYMVEFVERFMRETGLSF